MDSPDNQLIPLHDSSPAAVRSIWLRYQNAKWGWHVVVPLGLGGIAGAVLTWAWTMLDQHEYGVAMLLVFFFLVIGTGAAVAIQRAWLRVMALSCVIVITGFSGLKIWQEKRENPWTSLFKQMPQPSPSPEMFSVELSAAILDEIPPNVIPDKNAKGVTAFVMYNGVTISPVHVVLLLRVINRQNRMSMIDAFNIEMEVSPNNWVKLKRLDKGLVFNVGKSIRNCEGFRKAVYIEFERGWFEDAIRNKNIQDRETVEGWVFLQYPSEEYRVPNPQRRYRLNMRLTSGASFSGIIPFGKMIAPEDAVNLVMLKVGAEKDITAAFRRTYGDKTWLVDEETGERICK